MDGNLTVTTLSRSHDFIVGSLKLRAIFLSSHLGRLLGLLLIHKRHFLSVFYVGLHFLHIISYRYSRFVLSIFIRNIKLFDLDLQAFKIACMQCNGWGTIAPLVGIFWARCAQVDRGLGR